MMISSLLLIGGLGTPELIIILLVVLLLFGGKKIPELMKAMGKGVKKVNRSLQSSGHTHLTMRLYPGARHELLNETNRQEVYSDALLFLEAVAAGGEVE